MPSCLLRRGRQIDRRYLRLPLPGGMRCRVNRVTRTRLYSLGGHSPGFGSGLRAVNGFDNRFNRGFVDADFGNRLEMRHMMPKTLGGKALLLHFWHAGLTRPARTHRLPTGSGCTKTWRWTDTGRYPVLKTLPLVAAPIADCPAT